ncbi:MAG: lipopolysaccharide biosynthesis protein [Pirellulales bacterium]
MTLGADPHLEVALTGSWLDRLVARFLARFGVTAYHGTLSVFDQLVVGGSRLLTSIIVGRACGPEELGDYALGFVLFCFAVCVQTGLISLPYTLYYNYFEGDERRAYSGSMLVHLAVLGLAATATLGLVGGAFAWGYGPPELAPLVGILAITFPLVFLQEFARRFALARLEMRTVLSVDIAMAVIQVGGLAVLAALGWLSAIGAFAAMGVGAAIAGITWLVCAQRLFLIRRARLWADAKRNWRSGRWMLVSQLILATRVHSELWLVALLMDITSTGIFAACEVLVRLSTPFPIAVANILFPSAASAYAQGDTSKVRRLVRQSAAVLCAGALPFCLLFALFGAVLLTKLYGNAFAGQGVVVSLLALGVVADAVDTAASNGLFGIGRPNVHFYATALGTMITLAVSVVLIPRWGLIGAAQGRLVGRCFTSGVQWVAFFQLSNRLAPGELS